MILHNFFSGVFLFSDGYDSPCCKNCTYHNTKGTKCRDADTARCKKESYCDGKSHKCPAPEPMSDGTECIDRLVFLWSGKSTSLQCRCVLGASERYCRHLGRAKN